MITLHQDVSNKRDTQYDVVLDSLQAQILFQALDSSVRDGIAIDVVHDVHDDLEPRRQLME